MTPLDRDHAAMEAADDEAPRRAFFARLAASELHLLCAEESVGEVIKPQVFDLDQGRFVAVFDTAERLAAFVAAPAAYATLPARVLLEMTSGFGWALNPGVAPSAVLLDAAALDWMRGLLAEPAEAAERPVAILPPDPPTLGLLAAIEARLATVAGLAHAAYLATARYADGRRAPFLAVIDAAPGAQATLARPLAGAFRSVAAPEAEVAFLAADHPLVERFARVALRIDVPAPADPPRRAKPEGPPRLR